MTISCSDLEVQGFRLKAVDGPEGLRPSRPQAARIPRGPTNAGTPVGPGMPAAENPGPLTDQVFSMSSLSFYLPLVTKTVPTRRRCRVIAAAAAGAAILPLSVPLGARASPGGRETGT